MKRKRKSSALGICIQLNQILKTNHQRNVCLTIRRINIAIIQLKKGGHVLLRSYILLARNTKSVNKKKEIVSKSKSQIEKGGCTVKTQSKMKIKHKEGDQQRFSSQNENVLSMT